ncbi:MAG TPA: hypothetical protein VG963_34345, partial [Polyangiaceae bacterium]|nr:hypothetical protein [Polyangiaceae bacterium]
MKRGVGRRAALVRVGLAALSMAAHAYGAGDPGSVPTRASDSDAASPAAHPSSAPDLATLRWSGYLQVDWVVHNRASADELNLSTGAPLNQDRFLLRRGHLRLDAEHGPLSGALEVDANTTNGPQLRPIDAEISLRWPEARDALTPWVSVSAGLMKIPFGFEVPELDVERPFLERSSVARALFPGEFDLGARLSAQYHFLALGVALMNGHPLGEEGFPGLAPERRHEIVGRLGAHGELGPSVALDIGVSVDAGRGFHAGTPTT